MRRTYTVVLRHQLAGTYREADVYARSLTAAGMEVRVGPLEEIVSITAKAAPRYVGTAVREAR